ncbi:MAG: hypothetical protein AB7G11_10515 [Phycisphaerales bacterium]
MSGISCTEKDGVIVVTIVTAAYGHAGQHWRDVLDKPNHGGYGKIYIQRDGASQRRRIACWELSGLHAGNPAANLDECPGAMFIWSNQHKEPHVEPLCATANQKLGRDLGAHLRKFKQATPADLWEVKFRFL